MPTTVALLLLFVALASGILLALAFRLQLRYSAPYLGLYVYFMVATVSYGLVNWVGPVLHRHFSELAPEEGSEAILLLVVCAVPLVLAKLYLFVRLLLALLRQDIAPRFRQTLAIAGAVILLATLALAAQNFRSESLEHLGTFLLLLGILVIVADYLVLGYFLSRADHALDTDRQGHARSFGWAYLIGYFVYSTPFYLTSWVDLPWYPEAAPYLYYLMHLPPLVYLHRLSRSFVPEAETGAETERGLETMIETFGISQREAEVLALVLEGKSNQEVAEALFISPNTVRNHVYSIYNKTSVRNRLQLYSLAAEGRFQRGANH